jgi:hypothetical protein
MTTNWKRTALITATAGLVAVSFWAGGALADDDDAKCGKPDPELGTADPRLQQARESIDLARQLLKAADNPGRKVEFGGHRAKALHDLCQARKQTNKAIEWAKAHPPRVDGGPSSAQ